MTDYEDLQKRCQRGATNLNDANNLLAECYGMLGKLGAENKSANRHWANESNNVKALTAEVVRLKAENERLRKIATELRNWVGCENVHHDKREWHEWDDPCTVLTRIDKALSKEG
jgi:hypothetical protein